MKSGAIVSFIRANLPVSAVPAIPAIRLHKASPFSGLGRLARQDEDGFGSPYWAYHWAGGLVLARYLLDHPDQVAGRSVLDLGSGSGLVAIEAAKGGAATVMAAEVDAYAITALRLNTEENGAAVMIIHRDVTMDAPPAVDVVLLGDLFYDEDLARRVTLFLERCVAAGAKVLVGDPRRAHFPTDRLTLLAEHEVVEIEGAAPKLSSVFAFG